VLKRVENAKWITKNTVFTGVRYKFQVIFNRQSLSPKTWLTADEFDELSDSQFDEPVLLLVFGQRRWWWYHEEYWVEDEGLEAGDVRNLIEEKAIRQQRRLDKARAGWNKTCRHVGGATRSPMTSRCSFGNGTVGGA
jgi:hypothetical protein